jgi:hypothetical protein
MAYKQRAHILVMVMGLSLIPSWAKAGGADPAVIQAPPPVHRFLDGQNVALHTLSAILMVADIATTRRALQVPGTSEANPLMKSEGALISLKVASVGAGLGIAYMLHKSGHHKAERLIPMFIGVPSAVAAAHNAGIHQ